MSKERTLLQVLRWHIEDYLHRGSQHSLLFLAMQSHVDRTTISRIMNHHDFSPNWSTVRLLAETLSLSAGQIQELQDLHETASLPRRRTTAEQSIVIPKEPARDSESLPPLSPLVQRRIQEARRSRRAEPCESEMDDWWKP